MISEVQPSDLFNTDADRTTADQSRRAAVRKALGNYKNARGKSESAFASWSHARDAAATIKYEGVNHLDKYLREFEEKFTARGGKVFWASTSAQARICHQPSTRAVGQIDRQV